VAYKLPDLNVYSVLCILLHIWDGQMYKKIAFLFPVLMPLSIDIQSMCDGMHMGMYHRNGISALKLSTASKVG
jgi:hypothetical protein